MNQVNPTSGASSRSEERFPDATIITDDEAGQIWGTPVILDDETGLPKKIKLATESFPTTVAVKDSGHEAPQTPVGTAVTRLAGSTRRKFAMFCALFLGAVVTVGGALKVKQSENETARLQTQIDELKKDRTSERVEAELERMRAQVDRALWVSWLKRTRLDQAENSYNEKGRLADLFLDHLEEASKLAREKAECIEFMQGSAEEHFERLGQRYEDAFLLALRQQDGRLQQRFSNKMANIESGINDRFSRSERDFKARMEKYFGFRNTALAQKVREVAGRGHLATAEERTKYEEHVRSLGLRPKFTISMNAAKNPDGTYNIYIDGFTSDPFTDEQVAEIAIAVGAVPETYNFSEASIVMKSGANTEFNHIFLPGVRDLQHHFLEHDSRRGYPSFDAYELPNDKGTFFTYYSTLVATKKYSFTFTQPKEDKNKTE